MAWLAKILCSFGPALAGLSWAVKTQRNLQVHLIATALAIVFGVSLNIAVWEWCAVALAAEIVLTAELLNTALEVLADRVTKERDESIRRVKDAAAAAVLVAAIAALLVGVFIFLPKLWALL